MAAVLAMEANESGPATIHNDRGVIVARRILASVSDADFTPLIPHDFWQKHTGLSPREADRAGILLLKLYKGKIAADNAFGETFDESRKYREYNTATEEEIRLAVNNLGRRIFENLAVEYAHCNAVGAILEEAGAAKAWQAAFGLSEREIPQHVLEIARDKEGEPLISEIYAIAPDGRLSDIGRYQKMVRNALDQHPELFAQGFGLTFLVPVNTQIARLTPDEQNRQGIYVIPLPITRTQIPLFGLTMLLDDTRTSDSATYAEVKDHIARERRPVIVPSYRDGTK